MLELYRGSCRGVRVKIIKVISNNNKNLTDLFKPLSKKNIIFKTLNLEVCTYYILKHS